MKSYGVLVIGCGHIGMQHLLDIYYRDGIWIEAVVDKNPAAAEAAARRCGAHNWGTDYLPYLNSDNIDIVIIATYAGTHLSILKDCLAHHKHVLCEKPIGETLEQGMEFVETVKAAKEKVLIGHILRHNTSYQKMPPLQCKVCHFLLRFLQLFLKLIYSTQKLKTHRWQVFLLEFLEQCKKPLCHLFENY